MEERIVVTHSDFTEIRPQSEADLEANIQTIFRHEPRLREPDGARKLAKIEAKNGWSASQHTKSWNSDKWLEALSDASDRVRFEYCLNPQGEPQYIRSILSHSGIPRIDPKFFMLLEIPFKWKVHICHTGSSNTFRSSVERENWSREAPVIGEEDKHASSRLWTHWRSHCPISKNSPTKRPDLDAVHTFDLNIA